jgi:purine-binding chemotaxis protein CheW
LNRPSQAQADPQLSAPQAQAIELLTFLFNGIIFGLDILLVEEIHGYESIYSSINTKRGSDSVLSVRGAVVHMIDLAERFCVSSHRIAHPKNVIILNFRNKQYGIAIDGVTEVITTSLSLLSMPTQAEDSLRWFKYAAGSIRVDENLLVVLNLEKLISHNDSSLTCDLADE